MPATLCAMIPPSTSQVGLQDRRVYAAAVLESELSQDREDAELVDQIRRIQDVDSVWIVRIALDEQIGLERLNVLDQAIELVDPVLGDQLRLDRLRRHYCRSRCYSSSIVGQLVTRELGGDRMSLIANQPGQRGQSCH